MEVPSYFRRRRTIKVPAHEMSSLYHPPQYLNTETLKRATIHCYEG
jgi:hypothetical protein